MHVRLSSFRMNGNLSQICPKHLPLRQGAQQCLVFFFFFFL